jgi:cyclomaltodextrinase / maltogenic alpha-amylase / neopullulanase
MLGQNLPGCPVVSDPETLKPGRYRHFKGNEYDVIGVAKDSETLQAMVVYRALYGEHGLWIRPLAMFTEVIERDGQRIQRFHYVGED